MSTWPAFWMLGANFPDTPWPYSGEIDIMEVFQGVSKINTTHSTIHYFKDEAGEYTFTGDSRTFDFPLSDDYHIWTLEWDENVITAKIDDIIYFKRIIDPD